MKIIPSIVLTVFIKEIQEEKQDELLEHGRKILLGRGLIEIWKNNTKIIFRPRLMNHLGYNPFSFFIRTSLELKKNSRGKIEMRYVVVHPFSLIVPLLLFIFLPIDIHKPIFYVPVILIAASGTLNFFMQYPIFKQIIKVKYKPSLLTRIFLKS